MLGNLNEREEMSYYDKVGGHETFARLLRAFFERVETDPEIFAMYESDLDGAERRLCMFFEQYFGGPMTYSQTRGAPRLKMRHMPYKITPMVRDRWLALMHQAITEIELPSEEEFWMRDYVERAGDFLVNADD